MCMYWNLSGVLIDVSIKDSRSTIVECIVRVVTFVPVFNSDKGIRFLLSITLYEIPQRINDLILVCN